VERRRALRETEGRRSFDSEDQGSRKAPGDLENLLSVFPVTPGSSESLGFSGRTPAKAQGSHTETPGRFSECNMRLGGRSEIRFRVPGEHRTG